MGAQEQEDIEYCNDFVSVQWNKCQTHIVASYTTYLVLVAATKNHYTKHITREPLLPLCDL